MERTRTSYERAPEVPATLRRRWEAVIATLAGQTTVTDGAKALGMARVNFQTQVHRAAAAMVASLEPRPTGRAPKAPVVKALEAEVRRLRAKVARLEKQRDTMDELLGVAGDVIRELRGLPPLQWRTTSPRSTRSSPRSAGDRGDAEDPEPSHPSAPGTAPAGTIAETRTEDPQATALLAKVATMRDTRRAALAIGIAPSTLRRWRARRACQAPARRRRGGQWPRATAAAAAEVRILVRTLHGLVGAASLSHSIAGVSRRQAAVIKADELAAIERERRASCARVEVTTPGVLRGFDAMHVTLSAARRFVLVAADGSLPYRTSAVVVQTYASGAVAQALEQDFAQHGAPLVSRLDRASCQRTPEVLSVLARYGVLLLHGPPRCPRFYGQLERQNREHRAWLARAAPASDGELREEVARMLLALNGTWRRRTLAWCTSASLWDARPPLVADRAALREEVEDRAARLCDHRVEETLAMRLAIEQALMRRGYLRVHPGRRSAM